MSYIHFKTVYNLNFDKITFDGSSLSVGELKKLITEKAKFVKNKKVDFELELSNADTKKVYTNDEESIFKNTRILVKRIVKDSAAPLRAQEKTSVNQEPNPIQNLPKNVYDSLAPLNLPSQPLVYVDEKCESQSDEQTKLESILKNSMSKTLSETSIQTCRFLGMKPFTKPINSNSNPPSRSVPPGYICMICRKPGHLKQFCPEAANLPKPEDRPKYPSGIPRTNLRPAQPGEKFAMLGPEGYVVPEIEKEASKVIKKEKPLFNDEEENKETKIQTDTVIPKELKCPFGEHILKDAVLVPCCGHFICCDECIRNRISNEQQIECPNDACDQEIDSFSGITPYHEMRRKCTEFIMSKNQLSEKYSNLEKERETGKARLDQSGPEIQINQKSTRPIQHSLSESVIRNNIYENQYFYQQGGYYNHFGNQNGFVQNLSNFTNYYNFNAYEHQSFKYNGKHDQSGSLDRTLEIMTEKEFNEYKEKLLSDVNNRREMGKRDADEVKSKKNRYKKSRSRSRSRKYKKKNKSRSRSRERKKTRSYSRSASRTRSKKAKKKSSRKKSTSPHRTKSRSKSPLKRKDENMGKNYKLNDHDKGSYGKEKHSRKVLRSLSRSPTKYHRDKLRHKYK